VRNNFLIPPIRGLEGESGIFVRYFRKLGVHLSIPVKVMLVTGIAYLLTWLFGVFLEGRGWVNFSATVFSVEVRYYFWGLQVVVAALAATGSTHSFLDMPLRRLSNAMAHAEEGDFLIRAPVLSRDELGDLARSFNHMLSRLTDLAAHKIQAEHDLIVAQEQLKFRKQIEEKSRIIERTNRTLESLVKDLSLLYEIGQEVNSVIDLDMLYENITTTLKKYLKINEFAILIFDEKKENLYVKAASGFPDNDAILKTDFKKGEGISGTVAESGKRIYVKDTGKENRFLHYKGERKTESASLLSAPLIFKNEIMGVINFGRPGVNSFTFSDIKMLTLVAGHVALALANAKLYTKTRELSVKDELTQLYNRRHFQHMLQMEWKRAVRFFRDLSVIMIDVDHFKAYNDSFGHLNGDAVLRQIGQILQRNLREVDTVARFGGEEFVLLLPDTDKHGAIAVAEKIRRLVEQHKFTTEGREPTRSITISAGIASYPDDVSEMDDLIDHADIALFRAKDNGRNQVICYSPPSKAKKPVVVHPKSVIKEHGQNVAAEADAPTEVIPPTKTIQ
jgi:diguanylate cyclase (GGDEF)-like protein